jgi:SNF2 family DNA or RNA helicase
VTLREPSPKIDELVEIIAELGKRQFVVCAESRKLINLASARLAKIGVKHGLITGEVDQYERKTALDNLQEGKSQALLFTLKAGGTGLTMTAADTMIRLQRSWSMIDNAQAEKRVYRIGSERHESVQIIDIITMGTVEEVQLHRLLDKMRRLEEINRDRVTLIAAGMNTGDLDKFETLIMNSNLGVPTTNVDNLQAFNAHAVSDALSIFLGG